jgi:hypothetical protein
MHGDHLRSLYRRINYFSLTAAKTLLQPRIRNTIVTTWSSRISKSSSTANIPSRNANIPRSVHSAAHIVMFHLTTSSFKSPPPPYDPPANPPEPPRSDSPTSPRYSPDQGSPSSSSSSDDGIPDPPNIVSSTYVALLGNKDLDDLNLQHLEVRKILKKTHEQLTTDFKLQ